MLPTYKLASTMTVPNLARELYVLVDDTGTERAPALAEVAARLREQNPSLPSDDVTTVTSGTWVNVPPSRWPQRVPDVVSGVRAKLEGLSSPIRSLDQLRFADEDAIVAEDGTIVLADLRKLVRIGRLMAVRGVGSDVALLLHDDGSNPIQTPFELAEATQVVLAGILDTTAAGTTTWRDALPWSQLRAAAQFQTTTPRRKVRVTDVFVPANVLEQDANHWRRVLQEPGISAEERRSAEALYQFRRIQTEMMRGRQALRRGDGRRAMAHLHRVKRLTGVAASELGVTMTQAEIDSPTVEQVIEMARLALDRVEYADAFVSRENVGAPVDDEFFVVKQVTADELTSARFTTFRSTLEGKVGDQGRTYTDVWDRNLDGMLLSELTSNLKTDVAGTNVSRYVRDFTAGDRATVRSNVASISPATLASSYSAVESEARSAQSLRYSKQAFVASSEDPADWELDVALTDAARFPTYIHDKMTVFDRCVVFPRGTLLMDNPYLPLNDNFASEYRSRVMSVSANAVADGRIHNPSPMDQADPLAAIVRFPLEFARDVPLGLAAAHRMVGETSMAIAYCAMVPGSGVNFAGSMDTKIDPSLFIEPGTVDPDDIEATAFLEMLRDLNAEGNSHYKSGYLDIARTKYLEVRDLCERRTELQQVAADLASHFASDDDGSILALVRVGEISPGGRATQEPIIPGVWRKMVEPPPSLSQQSFGRDSAQFFAFDAVVGQTTGEETSFGEEHIPAELGLYPGADDFLEDPRTGKLGREVPEPGFPKATINPPGQEVVVLLDVDAAVTELIWADAKVTQIDAGLNWLGFDPGRMPLWRFDFLLSEARHFAARADELQSRSLSLLQALEAREVTEWQAEDAVLLAKEGEMVASAGVAVANANVAAAEQQQKSAKKAFGSSIAAAAGNGVPAVVPVVGAVVTGTALTAATGGTALIGVASAALGAIVGGGAAKQRQKVAEANLATAKAQLKVANAELDLAKLRAGLAADFLNALLGQTLTSDAYAALVEFVTALASDQLLLANRLAWLAEQAYVWETRSDSARILMSYQEEGSLESRFLGAALLRAHLDSLEHDRVSGVASRVQTVKWEVSLAALDPNALMTLRETGEACIRIGRKRMDRVLPGLSLHSLSRVEVAFDGLLPAGGVHAVLSTSGIDYVRVPNSGAHTSQTPEELLAYDWAYPETDYTLTGPTAAAYVLKPLNTTGVSQVLSQYERRGDAVVLAAPTGALDAFEHLTPTQSWVLTIPRSGNAFDLAGIADVRLVLYMTAQYDPALASRQREVLADDSMSVDDAEEFAVLHVGSVAAPETTDAFRVRSAARSRREYHVAVEGVS